MTELRTMTSGISGAPICAGGASPLRVATDGNANWSSEVRCRRSPARAVIVSAGRDSLLEIEINAGRANRVRLNRAPVPRPR